jgi:hypothetical protein
MAGFHTIVSAQKRKAIAVTRRAVTMQRSKSVDTHASLSVGSFSAQPCTSSACNSLHRSEKSMEVWAQATASATVGAADGRRTRIGCLFQYVSDRQHHSRGPKRKCRSQMGLTAREMAQHPATT